MLFALGFIMMFTLGGISGIMLAVIPFTIHVSDTYFIVAHITTCCSGARRVHDLRRDLPLVPEDDRPDVRRDAWQGPLLAVCVQPDLRPDAGIDGMPRRVADYAEQFATWNAIIRISAFIFGLVPALPAQHGRVLAAPPRPRPRTSGAPTDRRWFRPPPLRSTSAWCRRSSAVPTSTASRAPSTRSSRSASRPAATACHAAGAPALQVERILVVANDAAGRPLIEAEAPRGRRRGERT